MTEILSATPEGLSRAAAILRAGGLVALPTETVYGLGGDARNDHAVARIFAAKGRPHFNPLIVHLPDLASAEEFALLPEMARSLAAQFWPGPLTMVLPLRPDGGLSPLVTAGNDTVAIRVPAHPLASALLREFGGPVAAPSANPSGRVSPTRAAHVIDGLSGRIEAVIDGGSCSVGVESTILSLEPPRLLRPGGIAAEALETILKMKLPVGGDAQKPNAPGQLASHYAPAASVALDVSRGADEAARPQFTAPPHATGRPASRGQVHVTFGRAPGPGELTLSASGDLTEAAANLFHILREADRQAGAAGHISFAPVPDTGLGRAINDRLRRAAAPRPQI
jgi:L-threonylcarbamoyladenylate synthase